MKKPWLMLVGMIGCCLPNASCDEVSELEGSISMKVDGALIEYLRYSDDDLPTAYVHLSSDPNYPGAAAKGNHTDDDGHLINAISVHFPETSPGSWTETYDQSMLVPMLELYLGRDLYRSYPNAALTHEVNLNITVTEYGGPGGRLAGAFSGVLIFQDQTGLVDGKTVTITDGVFDLPFDTN